MAATVLSALQHLYQLEAGTSQQLRTFSASHREAVKVLIQQARHQHGAAPHKVEQHEDERAAKRAATSPAVSLDAMHDEAPCTTQHGNENVAPVMAPQPAASAAPAPAEPEPEPQASPQHIRPKRPARSAKAAVEKPAKAAKMRGGAVSHTAKAAATAVIEPTHTAGASTSEQAAPVPEVQQLEAVAPDVPFADEKPAAVPMAVDDTAQQAAPQPMDCEVQGTVPLLPAHAAVRKSDVSKARKASVAITATSCTDTQPPAPTPKQLAATELVSAACMPQALAPVSAAKPVAGARRSTRHKSIAPKPPTPKVTTPMTTEPASAAKPVLGPEETDQQTHVETGTSHTVQHACVPVAAAVAVPPLAPTPAAAAPTPEHGGDFQFQALPCMAGTPDNMHAQSAGTAAPLASCGRACTAPRSQRAHSGKLSVQPSPLPQPSPQPAQPPEGAPAEEQAAQSAATAQGELAAVEEEDQAVHEEGGAGDAEPVGEEQPAPGAGAAAASAQVKDEVPKGHNLLGSVRTFLPAKRAASPVIAGGKKQVKVKALEQAQAAKRVEEAKAAEKARLKEVQHQKPAAQAPKLAQDVPESDAPAAAGAQPTATASGTVKARVAAMQSRIQADEELRRREDVLRRQQEKDEAAKQVASSTAPAHLSQATADPTRAVVAAGGAARLDAAEKQRRAEAKRREDEEKRKADVEQKIKAKEERVKKLAAGQGQPIAATAAAGGAKAGVVPPAAGAKVAARPGPGAGASVALATVKVEAKEVKEVEKAGASKPQALPEVLQRHPSAPQHVADAPTTVKSTKQLLPRTPAEAAEEARNVQELMTSPYVNPGTHRTPGGMRSVLKSGVKLLTSYEISPYKEASDSDEDVDPCPERKPVPEWAHPARLMDALRKQSTLDPDKIFSTKEKTCALDDVFAGMPPPPPPDPAQAAKAHKKRDWHKRGSSGNWIADRLTWQEEIQYKRQMGYL